MPVGAMSQELRSLVELVHRPVPLAGSGSIRSLELNKTLFKVTFKTPTGRLTTSETLANHSKTRFRSCIRLQCLFLTALAHLYPMPVGAMSQELRSLVELVDRPAPFQERGVSARPGGGLFREECDILI